MTSKYILSQSFTFWPWLQKSAKFTVFCGLMDFNGKLIIFSAPSGSGKTTIVRHLLANLPGLAFSVSACTRSPRSNEVNGRDYYFMSETEFRSRIQNDEFVEYEEVYPGNFYGTLKSEITRLWKEEKHILFDIDVEGGLNIKKQYPDAALAVFVKLPSVEVLVDRLRNRSTETEEQVNMRVNKAVREMKYESRFDKVLVNDDLLKAFNEAETMVNEFIENS